MNPRRERRGSLTMESVELNNKAVERTGINYEKTACVIAFILATLVAVWLRFDQISLKPFHHDEGVNSHFLLALAAPNGSYRYNPENYHGPTLYFIALPVLRILGSSDLALRFTPALFGILSVLMIWLLRAHLGSIGTPVAAFMMALSPGLVYFSRDFIHEMSFGCFSLGVVVGAWRYAESKRFVWLALMASSAGLLFATKETAIITAVVMIIAAVCAELWVIMRNPAGTREIPIGRRFKRDLMALAASQDHCIAALLIFIFINIFFYSSFFTNLQGIPDAVKSIFLWTGRSGSEHKKEFLYYIGIMFKLELPLLIGSLLAGIFILRKGTKFWLFIGAWTLGMTLAYSLIGYKTPWLMISFLVPMALLSGHAAQQIYNASQNLSIRLLLAAAFVVVLIFNYRMAWTVNFDKYDDNSNASGYAVSLRRALDLIPSDDGLYGYVYAQTYRNIFDLIQAIKSEAGKLPSGLKTPIYVSMPEYWPLPWYLRDYPNVDFSGKLPENLNDPSKIPHPIIIANANQRPAFNDMPGWRLLPQAFNLRPGVELVIYVRDDAEQQ